MHQTVREFFLRPNRSTANSEFRISEKDTHICVSITCIWYLMLCTANMAKRFLDIKSWTEKHFEGYAKYLDGRPFANYAPCYLKHHLDSCYQDANVLDITS
jgi:hypothetical protein